MPAAASISVSASTKGSLSRAARRLPMVDLPTPIMPTSTIERPASADRMSGSGELGAGMAASDMGLSICRQRRHPLATYTTPQGASPEDSCHETANMLDDFIG